MHYALLRDLWYLWPTFNFWGKVKELSNAHQECLVQSDHLPVQERVQLGADETFTTDDNVVYHSHVTRG